MSVIAVWRGKAEARSPCWHFGVLMPDGTVIHLGRKFVKHTSYEIFRNPSNSLSPFHVYHVPVMVRGSERVVATRSFALLERDRSLGNGTLDEYHVMNFNCETFAMYCATGKIYSAQVVWVWSFVKGCIFFSVCLACRFFNLLDISNMTLVSFFAYLHNSFTMLLHMTLRWERAGNPSRLDSNYIFSRRCSNSSTSRNCPHGTQCRFIHTGDIKRKPTLQDFLSNRYPPGYWILFWVTLLVLEVVQLGFASQLKDIEDHQVSIGLYIGCFLSAPNSWGGVRAVYTKWGLFVSKIDRFLFQRDKRDC